MPGNLFIKLDGIEGESAQNGWTTWSELTDVDFSLEQEGTAASNSGLSGGRVQYGDLTVSKSVDIASAKLMLNCSNGKHIKKVEIVSLKQTGASDGKPEEYYRIELGDVLVSKYSAAPSEDGGVSEKIGFNYNTFKMVYKQQLNTGKLGKSTEMNWNIKEGKGG